MGITVVAAHCSVNNHANTKRNRLQHVGVTTQLDNVSRVTYLGKWQKKNLTLIVLMWRIG